VQAATYSILRGGREPPGLVTQYHRPSSPAQTPVRVDLPVGFPPIISDRVSLGRILAELLNNACKYTPEEGDLSIRYEQSEREKEKGSPSTSCLPTASTGFNIRNSAEFQQQSCRIFEKFYRVPNADPGNKDWLGASPRAEASQANGGNQVESTCGWTTFIVELTTPVALSEQYT